MASSEEDDALFRTSSPTEPPVPYAALHRAGVRTRYFGHACILVETEGRFSILTDPVISYDYHATSRATPTPTCRTVSTTW